MDSYPAATEQQPLAVDRDHHELMEFLFENSSMKQTARHSVKQGLLAGAGAVAGGILLGPLGGLLGGVAGSVLGFLMADDYDGAVQQLAQVQDKERLVRAVHSVLLAAGASAKQFESAEAFRSALLQLAQQRPVREQVWKACLEAIE
jgi:hypothetical protein